jgi:hypothetical protein
MEGEGSGAEGRAMAQNVEDGLEGMPPTPSNAPPVPLPAGVYPQASENQHAAAMGQLVSMWHTQQGLAEDATPLACAEQAGCDGSAWGVLAILALYQSVNRGPDGLALTQSQAAEDVLALDKSGSLRLVLEAGKSEGSAATCLRKIYSTLSVPSAKAAAWWVNGIEAWKRGGSGRAGTRKLKAVSPQETAAYLDAFWHRLGQPLVHSLIKRRASLRSHGILPSLQHLLSCPSKDQQAKGAL